MQSFKSYWLDDLPAKVNWYGKPPQGNINTKLTTANLSHYKHSLNNYDYELHKNKKLWFSTYDDNTYNCSQIVK